MLLVDCPLCGDAAPFDEGADALACDGCGVRLEVAPEPQVALPAAA